MKGKIIMFCPNCGFKNEDDARFCNECGAPLTAPSVPEQPPVEEEKVIIEEPAAQEVVPEEPVAPEEPAVPEEPAAPEEPVVPEEPAAPEEPPVFVPPVFPQEPMDRRPDVNTPPAGEYVPPFAPVPPVGPDRANVPPMQPPFASQPEPVGIHPVIAAMKKVFSSPLFITAVFASLAAVILSFIASVTTQTTFNVSVDNWSFKLTSGGSEIGSAVAGLIAGLVTPLALLLILIPAMNKKESRFSTAGFTILKVLAIIALVGVCIAGVAVIAGFVLLLVLNNGVVADYISKLGDAEFVETLKKAYGELNGVGLAAVIVAMAIIAAVLVLVIVFIAKYIKTLNTYKKVATKSVPSDRVSPFFAVVTIIGGICAVASAVVTAIYGLYVFAASLLLNALYMICFGLTVFRFRNEMRALKASMPAQPYVPQGYAPQGYAPAQPQGYAPQGFAPQYAPVVCPRCGTTFAPELAFCPHCGLPR